MTAEGKKLRDSMWDFKDSPPISVEDMSPEHRDLYEEAMVGADMIDEAMKAWVKESLKVYKNGKV